MRITPNKSNSIIVATAEMSSEFKQPIRLLKKNMCWTPLCLLRHAPQRGARRPPSPPCVQSKPRVARVSRSAGARASARRPKVVPAVNTDMVVIATPEA